MENIKISEDKLNETIKLHKKIVDIFNNSEDATIDVVIAVLSSTLSSVICQGNQPKYHYRQMVRHAITTLECDLKKELGQTIFDEEEDEKLYGGE